LNTPIDITPLPTEPEAPASDELVLFQGDTGKLPARTRDVFVQLLNGPSVDGRRQSKLWAVLLRDQDILRSRLHDLYLELVVDADQQVAFARQVGGDDNDFPVLLRRAQLSFIETALLLFMRQRLTVADAQGERAVLSQSEMLEHLGVFERSANVDHAKFERQKQGAVEKAKKLSVLQKIRGSEDRYEVSPTLKLLFKAEEIQALARTYAAMSEAPTAGDAGGAASAGEPAADEEDDDLGAAE
jgi:hypothetical protein